MTADRIRRISKGKRPVYFSDPAVDKLMAIVMSLVSELSVSRERIDALERVLEQKNIMTRDAIDRFVPDDAAHAEREAQRRAYIERVFRVVSMELQRIDDRGHTQEFDEALRNLLSGEGGD